MLVMIAFFLAVPESACTTIGGSRLLAICRNHIVLPWQDMVSLSLGVAAHGPAPERGLINVFPRELPETCPFPFSSSVFHYFHMCVFTS